MARSSFQSGLPGPVSSLEKPIASHFRIPSVPSVPRRARGPYLLFLLAAAALFYLHSINTSSSSVPTDLLPFLRDLPPSEGGPDPPRFYEWHEREKRLPQHDPNLPYPQGRQGRYIRFSNQVFGVCSQLPTSAARFQSLNVSSQA